MFLILILIYVTIFLWFKPAFDAVPLRVTYVNKLYYDWLTSSSKQVNLSLLNM